MNRWPHGRATEWRIALSIACMNISPRYAGSSCAVTSWLRENANPVHAELLSLEGCSQTTGKLRRVALVLALGHRIVERGHVDRSGNRDKVGRLRTAV